MREVLKIVCVLAFVAGVSSIASADTVLFQDDFNDNSLDSAKWTASGNFVSESDQVLKLVVNQTDNGGIVTSPLIPLANATGLITVARSVLVHKGSSHMRFWHRAYMANGTQATGTNYYNYTSGVDQVGFGHYNNRQATYDTWFDEVMTYDPVTGTTNYTNTLGANNVLGGTALVGDQIQFKWEPMCWYDGHYIYVDDVLVTQAPEPATMSLLALGGLALLRRRRR